MITKEDLDRFEACPTPLYFYDLAQLDRTVHRAKKAAEKYGYILHYAMKANAIDQVLDVMKRNGLGVDCVSGAEVSKALESGFAAESIAFAGVGKSDEEIIQAITSDIFTINVESLEELEVIEALASKLGRQARIAVRLNPDVDANTHKYITTGLEENKFGISGWQIDDVIDFLRGSTHLQLTGLHFHIGSQIRDLEPFKNLCGRITLALQRFADAGLHIEHINAGGGLGIDYDHPDDETDPDFERFFAVFDEFLDLRADQTLHFELGRSLVAHCADLIARTLYIKKGLKTNFMILDAGMTELIRPALYQAIHSVENLSKRGEEAVERYDVVGPVCESSDCFGKAMLLPLSERGDLIAIRSAGAYGESMASHYNLRSLRPAVYRD
ncbi:MAG: diaminopimelate decarboxylase [Flavobacteriales bacterium]|nr:diaminopimelate decarboxylase [Flavobacteriales bacterium]